MPGANGQGYHEELRQDQSREGDGDHVDELGLKEEEPHQHDHTTCMNVQGTALSCMWGALEVLSHIQT